MRRVDIRNDWESYIYTVNGVGLTRDEIMNIKEIYDKDGNKYDVKNYIKGIPYRDMGHTYTASRFIFYIDHPMGIIEITPQTEFYID